LRRIRIVSPSLVSVSSTSSALQCTDLARELIDIDVVTNDDVPIGVTNHDVVAQHFPLSGIASLDYARGGALFGKQLVYTTQCEATATRKFFGHEQAMPLRPPRGRSVLKLVGVVLEPKSRRQGRRTERLGGDSSGSADLSKFVREVRFLAGGDVRCLALATISLAEVVAA
jgi:hypothetical protein